jgi:cation:H+ antiporter
MTSLVLAMAGLAALFLGGDVLVRGASGLAAKLGMSPLMIGLTIVSLGTSAPELAVCVDAVLSDNAEIAVGNVVGSNISNVLLILGVTAIILPIAVAHQLVRFDVPIMIGTSVLFLAITLDGSLTRTDGCVLLAALVSYLGLLFLIHSRRKGRENAEQVPSDERTSRTSWLVYCGFVLAGLLLLAAGGNWLVKGAAGIAAALGISQLVIGLTVVAVGSSFPELVTAIVAAMRGQSDMAAGNIVGSNIANLLWIGGTASVVAPHAMPVPSAAIAFDIPVMTATAIACLPIFFTGFRIERWEGLLFLGYFAAYIAYVLLNAAGHDALPAYSFAMLLFVIPITAITLVVLAAGQFRAR